MIGFIEEGNSSFDIETRAARDLERVLLWEALLACLLHAHSRCPGKENGSVSQMVIVLVNVVVFANLYTASMSGNTEDGTPHILGMRCRGIMSLHSYMDGCQQHLILRRF